MITVLLLLVLLLTPLPAAANVIFDWTGTCVTVCAGQATFHVVTSDAYVPGTSVAFPAPGLLLTALYTDNVLSFDLAPVWQITGMSFLVPTTATQAGVISLFADDFRSDTQGVWRFGGESLRGKLPGCVVDPNPCTYTSRGIDGVWTRVPEPSTLVLLG